MNRLSLTILLVAVCLTSDLRAQTAASLSAEAKQAYNTVKNNILKAADKMPDDGFGFKPTPDLRSFAQVVDHVSEAQMRTCSAVLGDQKTVDATPKAAKHEVIAALQAAFNQCDKAYELLTDTNVTDAIKTPRGQRTKLGALVGNTSHDNEQYGIISVYLRLRSIVPPSSEH